MFLLYIITLCWELLSRFVYLLDFILQSAERARSFYGTCRACSIHFDVDSYAFRCTVPMICLFISHTGGKLLLSLLSDMCQVLTEECVIEARCLRCLKVAKCTNWFVHLKH